MSIIKNVPYRYRYTFGRVQASLTLLSLNAIGYGREVNQISLGGKMENKGLTLI